MGDAAGAGPSTPPPLQGDLMTTNDTRENSGLVIVDHCPGRGPAMPPAKQSIGKRYARMDEAGCPYCFTIDGQTLQDQTVTVRERDSMEQVRIATSQLRTYLCDKLDL